MTPSQGTFVFSDGTDEVWHLVRSPRARNLRIKMNVEDGIVIVVPRYMPCDPERTLERHRAWLERTRARIAPARTAYLARLDEPLPAIIIFPAIGETWRVALKATDTHGVSARAADATETGGTLRLSGNVADKALAFAALRRFTVSRAKAKLPDELSRVARCLGVSYAGCRVSCAHTRWGSCSAKGIIMLSANILFLDKPLAMHIMCHELAHIGRLDHSAAFHARLERFDPDAREHAANLRKADQYIPPWMRA